jgi:hypothetical protein
MEHAVEALAQSLNWKRVDDVPADVAAAVNHEVVWQGIDGLALDYFESYLSGDCCVLALGDGPDLPEQFIAQVELALEDSILAMGQLIDDVENADPEDLGRALIRLGLGAPLERHVEFFEILVHHATEPEDERVRDVALCAMAYTDWAEFVPILRRVRLDDPSERVRTRAEIVLRAFEKAFESNGDPE